MLSRTSIAGGLDYQEMGADSLQYRSPQQKPMKTSNPESSIDHYANRIPHEQVKSSSEKWTQLLSLSCHLKANHEHTNIRFNLMLDKGYITSPAQSLSSAVKLRNSSLSDFWVSKKRQVPFFDSEQPIDLAEIYSYIIKRLSDDKTNSFLGTLPKHLERVNQLSAELPTDSWPAHQNFERMNKLEFREHFLNSKKEALDLERVFKTVMVDDQVNLKNIICSDLEFLMLHKFGNYIVQKVIPLDSGIMLKAIQICRDKFDTYAVNEYSSRIMQCLVEKSAEFRLFTLKRFKARPGLWLKSIAALFVLSTCIKKAEMVSDFDFVKEILFKNKQQGLYASKYMKRALVSLVESCPDSELSTLFQELDIRKNILKILEDKYMTYLMVAFMRRSFMTCIMIVGEAITGKLKDLLQCSYFKLLINKLLSVGSPQALAGINTSLRRISLQNLKTLSSRGNNATNFYYYLFMTLSTFKKTDLRGLRDFLSYLTDSQLAQVVDRKLGILMETALAR